jgi:hypothetical protein
MPTCDEDDCHNDAKANCPQCGLFLCADHGGGDGNECDQCGGVMEEL